MRLPFLLKNRNFYLMLLMDAMLVACSMFLALSLRFDANIPVSYLRFFYDTLPLLLPLKLVVFYCCGLYYGMWRYTSLLDLRNVLIASALSSLLFLALLFLLQISPRIPRSVLIMDMVLTFLFVAGIRVVVRIGVAWHNNKGQVPLLESLSRKRMAILGAGHTGEALVREMITNAELRMRPVALFDDDPGKWGKTLHGCPVLGNVDQIIHYVKRFDEILIAFPSVKGERMRQIADLCEQIGKPFRIMPKMGEIMEGQVSVKATRKMRFEDLLGREEIHLERSLIEKSYSSKRILVTGAGGSIGSELVKQVAQYDPEELILADFSEYNLFRIDLLTRQLFPDISIKSELMDIRNMDSVQRVMMDSSPQIVLHAAAYKHVPLQEITPWEAVHNNVLGTKNMVEAALDHKAERFVLVSTDKAVRPANVMGATKRVAEMLTELQNGKTSCRFAAVRFGNVLGSSGSVIPIFEKQIESRMPVTVTHPEVTRYFMSVSEAAQLILQAGSMAKGGEVFILDMGQPVRIQDMARDLIRLHGLEPDKDIPIVYTGLRPGEKLYEELVTLGEGVLPTSHDKILVLRGSPISREVLNKCIFRLFEYAGRQDAQGIKDTLRELVPDYQPKMSSKADNET